MPPEMMTIDFFAEAYNFPPRVTRSLSLDELYWLPIIRQAKVRADKIRHDQERKPGGGRGR
jgi:hypothetical protein